MEVEVPSRNTILEFPDGTSEEVIAKTIREQFPRDGRDVAHDLASDPSYEAQMPVEDYRKYRVWLKEQDSPFWANVWEGVKGLGTTVKKAAIATVDASNLDPVVAASTVAEGAARGTADLYNMATQSPKPDAYMFRFKALLNKMFDGRGDAAELDQFRMARAIARERQAVMEGRETVLPLPKEWINSDLAEGFSLFLDPSVIAPGLGLTAKGGSRVASITGHTVENVGRLTKPLGNIARVADNVVETAANAAGVKPNTVKAAAGGAALLNPVSTGAATVYAGSKAAGLGGEVAQSVGRNIAEGPARVGPLARASADATISEGARKAAGIGARLGGDFVLDLAPRVAVGAGTGAAIGTALGYLSGGEEGAAQGLGAGFAMGAGGAGLGRTLGHLTGKVRSEAIGAEFSRYLESRPEEAGRITQLVDKAGQEKGVDLRPILIDVDARARAEGGRLVYLDKNSPPPAGASSTGFQGVYTTPSEGGVPTIHINVDLASKSTAPHELVHFLVDQVAAGTVRDELRGQIFGVNAPDGTMIQPGLLTKKEIANFGLRYARELEARQPDAAVNFKNALKAALDGDTTAQGKVSEELGAYYGGLKIFGKDGKTYKDALLRGQVPSAMSVLMGSVRDSLASRFAKDTGGSFDFSKGPEKGFLNANGERVRLPKLERLFDDLYRRNPLAEGQEKGSVRMRLGDSPQERMQRAKALGAEVLLDEQGNVRSKKQVEAAEQKRYAEMLQALRELPASERTSRLMASEDGSISLEGRLSDKELEAIWPFLNENHRSNLRTIADGMQDVAGNKIYRFSHWAASKVKGGRSRLDQVAVSNNRMLPYAIEINKEGGLYFRLLDIDEVGRRMDKALGQDAYKGLFNDKTEAIAELRDKYLSNLSSDTPKPSAEVFGGGETGAKKRDFFYEVVGTVPRQGQGFSNPARVGYVPGGDKSPFRSYRLERISRLVDTGESLPFTDKGYTYSQANFQPAPVKWGATEAVGGKSATSSAEGWRVMQGQRGYRLYKPDGSLQGIYSTEGTAMKRAQALQQRKAAK